MRWLLLAAAIGSEVVGTIALRYVDGLRRWEPLAVVVTGYALSFWLLALTLRVFELSTAYAIWAGAGTALVAGFGVLVLHEDLTMIKALGMVLVVLGVVALNLGGEH